jgi:nucleoside-diphosphate-sugar epimerase
MRVLVIGGSGYVGRLVLPALTEEFTVRVFDRQPPSDPGLEFVEGSVEDYNALRTAAEGTDAVLFMAMGAKRPWGSVEGIASSFDVSVKGLHLALYAAHQAGVSHAVYTSSMSVYESLHGRAFSDEEIPPDATDFYGFTKRLGEEVCRNAARAWGMSVNALRLYLPTPDEKWRGEARPDAPHLATAASDVARALIASLRYRGGGFEAFMTSGDYENRVLNMSKAKRLLGWEPLARP